MNVFLQFAFTFLRTAVGGTFSLSAGQFLAHECILQFSPVGVYTCFATVHCPIIRNWIQKSTLCHIKPMSSFWATWGCPCAPAPAPCRTHAIALPHTTASGCGAAAAWDLGSPAEQEGRLQNAVWGRYGLSAYILLANFLVYVYSLYSSNRQINFTQPFAGYFFCRIPNFHYHHTHCWIRRPCQIHMLMLHQETPLLYKKQSPPLIFCHVKVQGLEQASPIGSLPGQHLSVQIYSTSS